MNVQNVVADFGHVGGGLDFEGVEDAGNMGIVVGEVGELERFDGALNLVVAAVVVVEYVVGEFAYGIEKDRSHEKGAEDAENVAVLF